MVMNYYELLEVSPAASIEVIKNAYKTLAKKYHPDAYDGDKIFAEKKMKVLNEAISVLEDEEKRREYNMLNGIYSSEEIDVGNGLNINVDENGEPAFFSYSAEFEDDDVISRKSSFMDTIDDFIANRKIKKAKPRKGKSIDLDDLAETLNGDGLDDIDDLDIIRDISEMPETAGNVDNIDNEYNMKDFRTVKMAGKKNGIKAPRWYYITLACLITGCVVMFFLVIGSLNLGNVMDIMGRLSGGSEEEQSEEEYAEPTSDYAEHEETPDITTDVPVIAPEPTTIEDITPSQTEPTSPPPATTVQVAAPVTTAPPIEQTILPPPPPPTTTEPPVEQTTEEPTDIEDITEEPTEEYTSGEEEPTEETTTEEIPTIPAETEPEEVDAPEISDILFEIEE